MVRQFVSLRAVSVVAILVALGALPTIANCQTRTPGSVQFAGHRLQQVALTTRDLPRAIHFYRDVLGLPLLFESNGMAFFDVAGMRLMIAYDGNRPTGRATSVLYFDAPDFVSTAASLVTAGVDLEGPVETVQRTAAGDLMLQQFRDPDGNALAIMGTVPR